MTVALTSELAESLRLRVFVEMVAAFIASLKVIVIFVFLGTPVAPFAGFTAVILGGVVSWACVILLEETTTQQETRMAEIIRKKRVRTW